MKYILQKLVRLYQIILSPMMGNQCRFYPTCSCYMHEAIEKHGSLKGTALGIIRILKCGPWYRGNWIDPVPDIFYKTCNQTKTK